MATVTVRYGELVVVSERIGECCAFTCRLEIALSDVRRALLPNLSIDDEAWRRAEPAPGPGVLSAGAFRQSGETLYWDVQDLTKAVAIEMINARHTQLIVETDDPVAAVEQINRVLVSCVEGGSS